MSDRTLVEWLTDGEPADTGAPPLPEADAPRRSPWLLAVAAGLWLGVAVVAGQWVAARPPARPPAEPMVPAAAEPVPAPVDPPAAPLAAPWELPADTAVQAHAVLAVRERVSVAHGPERRYVDLAVAESVRWHGTIGVVGVLAHLLEGDESAWTASRVARFGVAVTLVDDQPVVVAGPWPVGDTRPQSPAEPDPTLEDAAREALAADGYRDVTDDATTVDGGEGSR